jgi:hypothetical protein
MAQPHRARATLPSQPRPHNVVYSLDPPRHLQRLSFKSVYILTGRPAINNYILLKHSIALFVTAPSLSIWLVIPWWPLSRPRTVYGSIRARTTPKREGNVDQLILNLDE